MKVHITLENRFFKNNDEWDYMLSQLLIKQTKRYKELSNPELIDTIELDISINTDTIKLYH